MNHGMNNPTGIYIQYYNAIAWTLTALGKTTTLKTPNTSSVTQDDLKILRTEIRSLAQNTLDMDEFNSHRNEEDAFDKYRMTVNDKQGFLVVPGKYTSNGPDLYEYELDENGDPLPDNVLLFSSVPVLYEHFLDMMKVLRSLKYIIQNTGGLRVDENRTNPIWRYYPNIPAGYDTSEYWPYYPGGEGTYNSWMMIRTTTTSPNCFTYGSAECRMNFVAQTQTSPGNWELLEDSDYHLFLLHKYYYAEHWYDEFVHEDKVEEYHWLDDEAPNSREFYEPALAPDYSVVAGHHIDISYSVPRQHIVYVVPDEFELPPALMLDHSENGLIYAGCEEDDFAKCSVQGSNEIRYGLGSSDNSGGARLRVYETNLFMTDFDAYCMSRHTSSLSAGSTVTVQRDGATVRFRFSTLLRPNGALVPMYWHFEAGEATFARPVTGQGYRLEMPVAGSYEVSFNDRAVHVFASNGAFSQAYLKKQDQVLTGNWSGVEISNASGTPSVCTVTTPQGTAQLNYTSGNPEALLTVAYRIPPGKLYGHTTVVSAGRKRGFIHRLLLDPSIANPTVDDLTVVSESYISLSPENPAEAPETETTAGPADAPYSSLKTVWGPTVGGLQTREITNTVNGASWTKNETVLPTSRGDLVLESTAGADSEQPLTTRSDYYGSGQLKYRIEPDGSWIYRYYDADERLIQEFRPFGNYALPKNTAGEILPPSSAECEVIDYSYEANAPGEIVEPGDTRVRRMIRKIQDIEVERSYQVYLANEYRSIRCRTAGATWDAPGNLVTTQYSYPSGAWQGRHWKTLNPDGTASLTSYAAGASGGLTETTDSGVLNPDGTAIIDGVRQIVTRNDLGFTTAREIVDIASGLTLDTTTYEVDFAGRPLKTIYADGSESTTIYACCGPYKQTDQAGTVTTTTYTPDKKVAGREQAGVRVAYTYAPNGGVAETRTIGTDGSYQLSVNQYAENGLLTAVKTALEAIPADTDPPETDDAYAITHFAESRTGDYWTKTVTDPEGGVRSEEYDRSGSLYRVFGSAVAAETEYQTLLLNAELCARSTLIRPGGIHEVTDVLTNFTGQQYKTVYPDGSYDLTEYDASDRPVKQTAADGTVRITEYNPKGEIARTGIDLDRDGELTGDDPATVYENDVVLRDTIVVRRRTTREQDGNDLVTVNVSEQTGDGNRSWQSSFGRTSSFRRSYIDDGEERGMTETAVQPDGVSETRSYHDGLLESSLHSVLGETLYTYDAFNRQETISHVEGGVEHVIAYQYDGRNQVTAISETGGSSSRETLFTYDLNGRKLSETRPGDRTVTYQYYPTGELKKVSGAETYPQSYTYEAGRLATLTTFRDAPELPAVTRWHYNAYGQLAAKEYADASRIDYTYNGFGQLVSRKWARNRITTYAYDNAGRLDGLTYDGSDTAPITYHYDQRGRLTQVADAAGTRTLTYNPDNTPAVETVPYAPLQPLHRSYDALGRPTEIRLGDGGCTYLCFNADPVRGIRRLTQTADNFTLEFAMGSWDERANLPYQPPNTTFTYDGVNYDDFGRPETHPAFGKHRERLAPYLIDETAGGFTLRYHYGDDGRLHQTTSAAGTQTTAYLEGSNRLASRTWRPAGGPPRTQTWSYDNFRRLTGIELDGNVLAGYTLDAADRRVRTALPDGSAWDYAYDDLGQLTSAQRDSINAMAYVYDTIGNRQTATEDAATTAYTANDLNQYTAVNSEIPTYDADGNLLTNAGWTYHWNAENRLIRAENGTVRVEANYDYQGRRFEKKVFYGNTLTQHQYFIYDGYKLAAILDALNDGQIMTTFTWQPTGPDTPLTMTYKGVTGYYLTDGNKNVLKVVKSDGTELATYTYSPFGQTLTAAGPWAQLNPFRFSSEYHDDETALIYYNYRHYSPGLGRWLSRDPIGEDGGRNLYGMVENNLINWFDSLGLNPMHIGVPGGFGYSPGNPSTPFGQKELEIANDAARATKNGFGIPEIPEIELGEFSEIILSDDASYCQCYLETYSETNLRRENIKRQRARYGSTKDHTILNAISHCVWQCRMACSPRCGPVFAKQVGDNHEFYDFGNNIQSNLMDLHNNEVGRRFWRAFSSWDFYQTEKVWTYCYSECEAAAYRGELSWFRNVDYETVGELNSWGTKILRDIQGLKFTHPLKIIEGATNALRSLNGK